MEQRLELFRERCAAAGLAVTHQRQVIYRELAATAEHPTPEAIYERVRESIPEISLATVYKNIKIFTEAGLLREVSLLHDSQRLDANLQPHHHLICVQCKSVADLPTDALEPVRPAGRLPNDFSAERFSVDVLGYCSRCARDR